MLFKNDKNKGKDNIDNKGNSGLELILEQITKKDDLIHHYDLEKEILIDKKMEELKRIIAIIKCEKNNYLNLLNMYNGAISVLNTSTGQNRSQHFYLHQNSGTNIITDLCNADEKIKTATEKISNELISPLVQYLKSIDSNFEIKRNDLINDLSIIETEINSMLMNTAEFPPSKFSQIEKDNYIENKKTDDDKKKKKQRIGFFKKLGVGVAIIAAGIGSYFVGYHTDNKKIVERDQPTIISNKKSNEKPIILKPQLLPYDYNSGVVITPGGSLYDILRKQGLWGLAKELGLTDNLDISRFVRRLSDENKLPRIDINKDKIYSDRWNVKDLKGSEYNEPGTIWISDNLIKEFGIKEEKLEEVYKKGLGNEVNIGIDDKVNHSKIGVTNQLEHLSDNIKLKSTSIYSFNSINEIVTQYNTGRINLKTTKNLLNNIGKSNLNIALELYKTNYNQKNRDSYVSITDISEITGVSKHQIYKNTEFRRSKVKKTNINAVLSAEIQYAIV